MSVSSLAYIYPARLATDAAPLLPRAQPVLDRLRPLLRHNLGGLLRFHEIH